MFPFSIGKKCFFPPWLTVAWRLPYWPAHGLPHTTGPGHAHGRARDPPLGPGIGSWCRQVFCLLLTKAQNSERAGHRPVALSCGHCSPAGSPHGQRFTEATPSFL